jgi:hypothetical protein
MVSRDSERVGGDSRAHQRYGVYGKLSTAHLDPHVEAVAAVAAENAASDAKIAAQKDVITGLERQIAQIDNAVDEANKRGHAALAMTIANDQGKTRETLVNQKSTAETALIELKIAQANIAGEQQRAAADIRVLEYAAALVGIDRERAIQFLILAMVLTCDPVSLFLVIATGAHNRRSKKEPALPGACIGRDHGIDGQIGDCGACPTCHKALCADAGGAGNDQVDGVAPA